MRAANGNKFTVLGMFERDNYIGAIKLMDGKEVFGVFFEEGVFKDNFLYEVIYKG